MWQTESQILISRPPTEVFDYLADFSTHHEWAHALESMEQLEGEGTHVGAEYRAHEVAPVKFVSFARVTRLERPSVIAWTAWDNRTFRVEWTFEVTEREAATLLVQRATFLPQNLLGRVLLRVIRRRQIPRENARSLEAIRERLEQSLAGPAERSGIADALGARAS